MKKYLVLLFLIIGYSGFAHDGANYRYSDMRASMGPNDKAAILMVHFGTTHADTRALTIDALNEKVRAAFSETEVHEAYTSRMIIRRLKAEGIEKQNPAEALEQLKADGFTHILIQSSNIIEGAEMESLRRDAAAMQDQFKEIRVGNPLLYTPEDYEVVIEILTRRAGENEAVVLVGHGTYTPATAQYAMLDYMLKYKGLDRYYVTTVEGYPDYATTIAQLKKNQIQKVQLVPFMFVAGDHAKNDIAGEMTETLIENGFQAETLMEGLGQNEAIRDLLIDHIRFGFKHKMQDILVKKKRYEVSDHEYEDEDGHEHNHEHNHEHEHQH